MGVFFQTRRRILNQILSQKNIMEVILYQIGIFFLIQIASIFGKSLRNFAIFFICIFTISQIFTSWLLVLQFITIYFSYNISNKLFFKDSEKEIKSNKMRYSYTDENGGKVLTEIDLDDKNLDPKIKSRAILQNKIRQDSLDNYKNDPEYKKITDELMSKMFEKK